MTTGTRASTSRRAASTDALQTAGVVDRHEAQRIAEHAAAAVEIADRHLDRDPIARARQRVGSAQWIGEADLDLGPGIASCCERKRARQQAEKVPAHDNPPRAAGAGGRPR